MSAPQRDRAAALTTATIFDDAVYCAEALHLSANATEDGLDRELVRAAEESGVQEPAKFLRSPHDISRALSTVTLDSDLRSSLSVHSQDTQSTSFTSAPSPTSRDHSRNSDRLPAMRNPLKPVRTSPTLQHHDPLPDASPARVPQRLSSSTLSIAPSVLSDSSSSSHPVTRKRRAGLLGLFSRKSPSFCTSQSHRAPQSRSRTTRLDCGHALSPDAIHAHIAEALQSGGQTVPSCCGIPLPRRVLELVMTVEEADILVNKALSSSGLVITRDSGYSESGLSAMASPGNSLPASPKSPPVVTSRRRHEVINIDSALAKEAFKRFQSQEDEQFQRVSAFESNQRKALSAHHASSIKQLTALHAASREEKLQKHILELEHLEEMQIMAEHDLRTAHGVETQNVATALKHMEAYCLGSGPSHPEHSHVVTEEDFKKLDGQRMIQQNLPRKHENEINVLRARQERQMKNKFRKQEAELSLLDATQEQEMAAKQAEHATELDKLETLIQSRRRRLQQRWDLKSEMWRKDWETQHETCIDFSLEYDTWSLHTTQTMTPIPESSALAPFVQAAA